MDTLSRHWAILNMIPRKGFRTSSIDILERLRTEYDIEVDLRTVQRDLRILESQFPLDCMESRPSSWKWSEDAPVLTLPIMDPLAALTFRLVQDSMKRMLPRAAVSSLEGYFRAADDRLKKLPDSNLSHWPDKVRVVSRSLTLEAPEVDENVLDSLYEALQHEICFEVEYRTRSGKGKIYVASPLGLVFVDNIIYLVATLNDHDDPVQLLVHRMKSIKLLPDKPVIVPEGFKLQSYIDKGEFGYPLGGMIKLKVLCDKKAVPYLYETKLAPDQKLIEQAGEKVLLEATMRDDVQLRWWLKGFGEQVEVKEPISLRQEFVEMSKAMSSVYNI